MTEPTMLRPTPSTGLVPMLTDLLGRAQRGEIEQLAVAFIAPGGSEHCCGTFISDREDVAVDHSTLKLIGAVADLQHTLLRLHNEQQP